MLGTPPAFILSQDQTLQLIILVTAIDRLKIERQIDYILFDRLFVLLAESNPSQEPTLALPLFSFQRTDAVPFFGANGESTGIAPWPSSPVSYTHLTLPTILRV